MGTRARDVVARDGARARRTRRRGVRRGGGDARCDRLARATSALLGAPDASDARVGGMEEAERFARVLALAGASERVERRSRERVDAFEAFRARAAAERVAATEPETVAVATEDEVDELDVVGMEEAEVRCEALAPGVASMAIEDAVELISLEPAPTSGRDTSARETDPFASFGDVTLETTSAVVGGEDGDEDEFGDFAGSGEGGTETATVDDDEFGDFV